MKNNQKTMLVTGASRGIGASIALLASQEGYKVGINYNNSKDAALKLVETIQKNGGQAVAIQADVSQSPQVTRMFEEFDAAFGKLDVLINNAGQLASFMITEVDEKNLSGLYGANVFSVYYCAREAVKRMSTQNGGKGGVIVNMSSVAARLGGLGGGSGYAGTKGALDSFNLSLAKEVGAFGIRVNAVRPGLISTEIHNVHGGIAPMEQMAKNVVPMGRAGGPDEVAKVVVWLASDGASYVHGSIVDVAGGR